MTKKKKKAASAVVNGMQNLQLLGEVCSWIPGRNNTHHSIVSALKAEGLDESFAKELTPRSAFTRAIKQLSDSRIIDEIDTDGDQIIFQFTAKASQADESGEEKKEIGHKKECYLRLNTITGKISCKKRPDLQEKAQAELDLRMSHRTGNDVTQIVEKLFQTQMEELVHLDAGMYFVPSQHAAFVGKIDRFLRALGGRVNRFPVPKGTQEGDRSIQEGVAAHFERVLKDHNDAVDAFSISTRPQTMADTAEKIKLTRIKIEAFASYLNDKRDELLAFTEEANAKLIARIEKLADEKEAADKEIVEEAPMPTTEEKA